jgi:hypothetical protein
MILITYMNYINIKLIIQVQIIIFNKINRKSSVSPKKAITGNHLDE